MRCSFAARRRQPAFTALLPDARRRPCASLAPKCPQEPLSHMFDMVALCYELTASTRCDSRPAPAQLAALLEALKEI